MSEANQQILEIVRAHGPCNLDDIAKRATLSVDKKQIAHAVFRLRERGKILRTADKRYVINGKNADASPVGSTGRSMAEICDKFTRQAPPRASSDEPSAEDGPEITTRQQAMAIAELCCPDRAGKPAHRPQDTVKPVIVGRHDALQQAADSAQAVLDALLDELGDRGHLLRNAIACREATLVALYRHTAST